MEGVGMVGNALQNLAPQIAHRPIGLLTTSMTQAMKGSIAEHRLAYNAVSGAGQTLMGVGGALSVVPGMQIPGAIMSGAGGVVGIMSQIIGQRGEAAITKQYTQLSSSINFVAAGLNMLLLPINLFRQGLNGVLGLFNKVKGAGLNLWGNAQTRWSQQWGMPLTSLTGISSASYLSMLAGDTAFGFRQGTLNAMHNELAYAQAGMYTSGRFDEKRLLAAARLGIFSDVYAPMGGNTQNQMARIVNTLSGRLAGYKDGSSAAQELMYFANDINGALPEILQRMARWKKYGIYNGGYEAIQDGSFFYKHRGVKQWAWTNEQHALYDLRAAEFGAARMQTARSLEHLFTPAWDKVGKPLYNIFNGLIENLANELDSMKDSSELFPKIKSIASNFWAQVAEEFKLDKSKNPIDTAFDWLTEKVQDLLKTGVGQGIIDAVKFALNSIDSLETQALNALKKPLSAMMEYFSDMRITMEQDSYGWHPVYHSPEEIEAERAADRVKALQKERSLLEGHGMRPLMFEQSAAGFMDFLDANDLGDVKQLFYDEDKKYTAFVKGETLHNEASSWYSKAINDPAFFYNILYELSYAKSKGYSRDYNDIFAKYGVPVKLASKYADSYINFAQESKSQANGMLQNALTNVEKSIGDLKIVIEDKTKNGVKATTDEGAVDKLKQYVNSLAQIFFKLGGTE